MNISPIDGLRLIPIVDLGGNAVNVLGAALSVCAICDHDQLHHTPVRDCSTIDSTF
jgi:hypothetical protein